MAYVHDNGPPSLAAVALGSALISGVMGYFIGQGRSLGLFGQPQTRVPSRTDHGSDSSDDSHDEDDDDDLQDLGELKTFAGNSEECKLVLVVRTDLAMGKGKLACISCISLPHRHAHVQLFSLSRQALLSSLCHAKHFFLLSVAPSISSSSPAHDHLHGSM